MNQIYFALKLASSSHITHAIILSFCFFVSFAHSQTNQESQLKYGKHSVGFEVIQTYDYSRPYKLNYNGNFVPRPMQIGIWFPGKKTDSASIKINEMLGLKKTDETLGSLSSSKLESDKESVTNSFGNSLRSILNAKRKSGSFPLIIYATSQGDFGYDNALLCELLASNGYIVATTSSKGAFSRSMIFTAEGANAQSRDMEFIYGYLHKYPNVNLKQIGTVGYSFGGLSMIIFSLRNKQVKAMVSFDGSSSNGYDIIKSFPAVNIAEFNSNILAFLGDKALIDRHALFNDIRMADSFIFKLRYLNHLDFSSTNLSLRARPEKINRSYVSMANLTVDFINTNFRNDTKFAHDISHYPKNVFSNFRQKKSIGKPIVTKDQYVSFVKENGVDAGSEVYYKTKKDFPNYKLFEYQEFRYVGVRLMRQKKYKDALKVFIILMDAFPKKADSFRRLGEAYMENGDYKKAKLFLNKGLEIDPDSPAMKSILDQTIKRQNINR